MSSPIRRLYEVRAAWLEDSPIIGRLSVPLPSSSRSGSSSKNPSSGFQLPPVPAFEYDAAWIESGFALGGDLPLARGVRVPALGKPLFGFLEDRALSASNRVVFTSGTRPHPSCPEDASPAETAALLLPDAEDAFGGLSLIPIGCPKVPSRPRIVRATMLGDLIYAYHAYERGRARDPDIDLLRRGLTLPGRDPVFCVERARECQTVRLRSMNDPVDRPLWQGIALETASRCAIKTALFDFEREMGETILFSRRVDRAPQQDRPDSPATRRLPVFSAAALTAAPAENARGRALPAGYLAIADILNREGAVPSKDLPEVFRRMLFSLLTGAGTDSLRRWLFVREPLGWRLLPAHSLEWALPGRTASGGLTLDGRRRLSDADDASLYAPYFGLTVSEAKMMLMEMRRVLTGWEQIAAELGADPRDIAMMTPSLDLF